MNKLILLICVLCVLGCAKHENFPDPLAISEPPVVSNLVVDSPSPLNYDITWNIGDPSVVDHYNIYTASPYGPPELQGTSDTTTYLAQATFEIPGLAFGVAVVTNENVEGRVVYAVAP